MTVDVAEPAGEPRPARVPRSRWRRVWLVLRIVLLLGAAYLAIQVVISNSAELSGAASYLANASWGWIVVAAVAEALSYLSFAWLQQHLLSTGGVRIGLGPLAALSLAGNAIANSLPGGGAFASVFAYRQFRRRGADEAVTTWTMVAFTALTAITLAAIAVAGLIIAGSDSGVAGLWPLAGALVVFPMLGLAVLLRPRILSVLLRRPLAWAHRRFFRSKPDPVAMLDRLVERLETVSPRPSDWALGFMFAGGNWLADMSCLVIAFLAVGAHVPWRGLLVAYGAAQVASNLPITPGGLGVVEGSLTVALVAFGGSTAQTVAAVLLYRILSFWVILPIGWTAYGGLHLTARRAEVVRS